METRLKELLDRMTGAPRDNTSASEKHEVRDYVLAMSAELDVLHRLEELVRQKMADEDSGRIERPNGFGSRIELPPETDSALYAVLSRLETVRKKLGQTTPGALVSSRNGL